MSEPSMGETGEVLEWQLHTTNPDGGEFDPATLVRFSSAIPMRLSAHERDELSERASTLGPWVQGPFLIAEDLILGGGWRTDHRWANLGPEVPEDLQGKRVLDVGSNAGYDPFMFSLRGPDYVLGCEPFGFVKQAELLESIYKTGVNIQPIGWQELDPRHDGAYDLVHCHGVLYHEADPLGLLDCLYEMTAPGGLLLFGSMMHADPALAEMTRFVPRSYFGDDSWWFVPGPLALRAMIESVGFEVDHTFGEAPGPPGEFPTLNGYVSATRPG